jgi:hypothetical protein
MASTAKSARELELEAALERAKKLLCPYCAAGDPMTLDDDGVNRNGEYHSFYGGAMKCRAAFIQRLLPSPKGPPLRK